MTRDRTVKPPPNLPTDEELLTTFDDLGANGAAIATLARRHDATPRTIAWRLRLAREDANRELRRNDPEWPLRGACRDQDLAAFFVDEHYIEQVEYAKSFCNRCAVKQRCRDETDALEQVQQPYGIFGGELASERLSRKRSVARAASVEMGRVQ